MNAADREIALHNRIREQEAILDAIAEDVDPGRPLLTMTQTRELPDRVRAVLHERDTARAEADALRAEVARLRPLRALFDHAIASNIYIDVEWYPSRAPHGAAVHLDDWACELRDLDAVIAAACERLGVSHG